MDNQSISFTILPCGGNMCRITAHTILSELRHISDGACICSLDVMLSEMQRIDAYVQEHYNAKAVFTLL